ncbi:hypothetical protein DFH27DRAFT_619266 [Peziza echinospora]|nr:hypothetical protein DFH27DRAFT_619266 [Peziza echinospora]
MSNASYKLSAKEIKMIEKYRKKYNRVEQVTNGNGNSTIEPRKSSQRDDLVPIVQRSGDSRQIHFSKVDRHEKERLSVALPNTPRSNTGVAGETVVDERDKSCRDHDRDRRPNVEKWALSHTPSQASSSRYKSSSFKTYDDEHERSIRNIEERERFRDCSSQEASRRPYKTKSTRRKHKDHESDTESSSSTGSVRQIHVHSQHGSKTARTKHNFKGQAKKVIQSLPKAPISERKSHEKPQPRYSRQSEDYDSSSTGNDLESDESTESEETEMSIPAASKRSKRHKPRVSEELRGISDRQEINKHGHIRKRKTIPKPQVGKRGILPHQVKFILGLSEYEYSVIRAFTREIANYRRLRKIGEVSAFRNKSSVKIGLAVQDLNEAYPFLQAAERDWAAEWFVHDVIINFNQGIRRKIAAQMEREQATKALAEATSSVNAEEDISGHIEMVEKLARISQKAKDDNAKEKRRQRDLQSHPKRGVGLQAAASKTQFQQTVGRYTNTQVSQPIGTTSAPNERHFTQSNLIPTVDLRSPPPSELVQKIATGSQNSNSRKAEPAKEPKRNLLYHRQYTPSQPEYYDDHLNPDIDEENVYLPDNVDFESTSNHEDHDEYDTFMDQGINSDESDNDEIAMDSPLGSANSKSQTTNSSFVPNNMIKTSKKLQNQSQSHSRNKYKEECIEFESSKALKEIKSISFQSQRSETSQKARYTTQHDTIDEGNNHDYVRRTTASRENSEDYHYYINHHELSREFREISPTPPVEDGSDIYDNDPDDNNKSDNDDSENASIDEDYGNRSDTEEVDKIDRNNNIVHVRCNERSESLPQSFELNQTLETNLSQLLSNIQPNSRPIHGKYRKEALSDSPSFSRCGTEVSDSSPHPVLHELFHKKYHNKVQDKTSTSNAKSTSHSDQVQDKASTLIQTRPVESANQMGKGVLEIVEDVNSTNQKVPEDGISQIQLLRRQDAYVNQEVTRKPDYMSNELKPNDANGFKSEVSDVQESDVHDLDKPTSAEIVSINEEHQRNPVQIKEMQVDTNDKNLDAYSLYAKSKRLENPRVSTQVQDYVQQAILHL